MTNSLRLSHASETCRLEWRPSRLVSAALLGIGVLAAFSVVVSEMPRAAAWPLAAAALAWAAVTARREHARPVRAIVWDGRANLVRVDGVVVSEPRLQWRGPLAFVSWQRSGHGRERLAFWPDTLDAPHRRELRLAAGPGSAAPDRASVAP